MMTRATSLIHPSADQLARRMRRADGGYIVLPRAVWPADNPPHAGAITPDGPDYRLTTWGQYPRADGIYPSIQAARLALASALIWSTAVEA